MMRSVRFIRAERSFPQICDEPNHIWASFVVTGNPFEANVRYRFQSGCCRRAFPLYGPIFAASDSRCGGVPGLCLGLRERLLR